MKLTANEVDVYVGRRLRNRRASLGLSQGQLGQHLGLTFSQVQKYEKGSNRIGTGRLFLLSQCLGVPIQYFYDGLGGIAHKARMRQSDAQSVELGALDSAFMSIADSTTRQSVLSLIRTLADADTPRSSRNKVAPREHAASYGEGSQQAGE